jgi:hypothetical protein
MGGVGSGSWYRFNKKTTTGECQTIDVRHLHRNGLLRPGTRSPYGGRGLADRVAP